VAQKVQTLYIDDMDGSEAEGTVRFGLNGAEYEIDLSAAHSKRSVPVCSRTLHMPARSAAPAEPAGRGAVRALLTPT
jgi:hypothetical protein